MGSPLQDAIQGYLDAKGSDGQANDIIADLAQPVEQALSKTGQTSDAEDQLWSLWRAVIATARQTAHDDAERKRKLTDLVLSIQDRTVSTDTNPSALKVQGMTVWSDLPILGWALRDSWNNTATDSDPVEKRSEWVNLNSWCAALTAKTFERQRQQPDATLLGLWTIRDALESNDDQSQTALAAAAVWFSDAAASIWELSRAEKAFDGKIAKPGPRFESEEWKGFSQKRWQAWDDRLADIAKSENIDEPTSALVRDARKAMQRVVQD